MHIKKSTTQVGDSGWNADIISLKRLQEKKKEGANLKLLWKIMF